jgi:Flp pilus assembly protein TadD
MARLISLRERAPSQFHLFFLLICILFLCGGDSWTQSLSNNPGNSQTAAARDAATESTYLDPDLVQSRVLLDQGDVEQAGQIVRKFAQTHPDSADAHFLLGLILFKAVKAKESLAEYTEGAKHRQPSPYDLEIVALDYVLLHDYMDADRWLSKSLEGNPNNSEGWYYLGRTKYNENRFEEAVQAFEQCLKREPTNVKAEDNLGLSYAALGRNDDAIAAYRRAIGWQAHTADKDSGPFLDLGSLLLDQRRTKEAIPYLMEAAQLSAADSRAHEQLGKAYEADGRLPDAQRELEKAVELSPQDPALHFVLGRVFQKQKLMDKAKTEFARSGQLSQAQASNPKTP